MKSLTPWRCSQLPFGVAFYRNCNSLWIHMVVVMLKAVILIGMSTFKCCVDCYIICFQLLYECYVNWYVNCYVVLLIVVSCYFYVYCYARWYISCCVKFLLGAILIVIVLLVVILIVVLIGIYCYLNCYVTLTFMLQQSKLDSEENGPKRLHISNIPFRFRENDLRTLLEAGYL